MLAPDKIYLKTGTLKRIKNNDYQKSVKGPGTIFFCPLQKIFIILTATGAYCKKVVKLFFGFGIRSLYLSSRYRYSLAGERVEVAISAWGWASAPHPQQAWSQIPS
jgi:hypothetical protein